MITHLSQKSAQQLDLRLMASIGERGGAFSIDQLMELAGLSVAQAIHAHYHPSKSRAVLVCGPGNNGGDALVAARHLKHFGWSPSIVYPKEPKLELYQRLLQQCRNLDIQVSKEFARVVGDDCVVVDGIFGFGFHSVDGNIRPPFDKILDDFKALSVPIVSIDVPSGWDVDEESPINGNRFVPDMLVSLTAPKLCARGFRGVHYVGGRFVPR
eukprot:Partr_v1_DN27369_c1_g1_i3_m46469 putative Catalyzes the epimerization of the S- and R-forms of NAD(P)HX, a damaged form of NAD(P)H that is a result of enzymatic or heat-dependent hydration. This is a prerequisite for the S- specific NAD(P)H-hydrate dehydratase to allow the repair of both epimers of NAD(P)HX (By similarity)